MSSAERIEQPATIPSRWCAVGCGPVASRRRSPRRRAWGGCPALLLAGGLLALLLAPLLRGRLLRRLLLRGGLLPGRGRLLRRVRVARRARPGRPSLVRPPALVIVVARRRADHGATGAQHLG